MCVCVCFVWGLLSGKSLCCVLLLAVNRTGKEMENIANMDTLCRVCSSAGSHSIFGRIPAYCHEHYREYARWKQPIFMLIAEVTGVEVGTRSLFTSARRRESIRIDANN